MQMRMYLFRLPYNSLPHLYAAFHCHHNFVLGEDLYLRHQLADEAFIPLSDIRRGVLQNLRGSFESSVCFVLLFVVCKHGRAFFFRRVCSSKISLNWLS